MPLTKGTAGQPLKINSGGTDLEYGTLPVAGGGTGAVTLTGILKGAGTSAITAVAAPTGAILGDSDVQNITGGKTFFDQTFKQRNPANTFTLTWRHPVLTGSDKDRRAYQPYNYLLYLEGGVWYVKSGFTEAIDNSNASLTTMLQWALDNLTASRTQKEIVKVIGTGTITQVTLPSYLALDLTAARITQANSANTNMFINNDSSGGNTQIEVWGGILDGNKANNAEDNGPVTPPLGQVGSRNIFHWNKVTNSSIHDVYMQNANSCGLYTWGACQNISVHDCTIIDSEKLGIFFDGTTLPMGTSKYLYCRDNYIAGQDENPVASNGPSDVWIEGNACIGCTVTTGINVSGARNHINRNYVRDMQYSGIVMNSEGTFTTDDSEICDNWVENCCLNAASVGSISSGAGYPSDHIIIKGNRVQGAASGSNLAVGIRLSASENSIISDNIVWNNTRSGILVTGSTTVAGDGRNFEAQKIDIHDNICFDNGKYTTDTNSYNRSGIVIRGSTYTSGNVMGINVHDNICYDNGAVTQKYGLHIDNCDDIWVHNNDFRGNTTAGIITSGTIATARIERNLGYVTENSGSSTQSGNGSTKVFNIAHGLVAAPTKYIVQPGSADAIGPPYLTADATNLIVTYPTAPPSGSSNLVLRWLAEVV